MLGEIGSLPGFVRSRILLLGLGAHAIPVDGKMGRALAKAGFVRGPWDPDAIATTLERAVRSAESLWFHTKLEHWLDARGTDAKRERREDGGGATPEIVGTRPDPARPAQGGRRVSGPRRFRPMAVALSCAALLGSCSHGPGDRRAAYEPLKDPQRAMASIELRAERESMRPRTGRHDLALAMLGDAIDRPAPGSAAASRARTPLGELRDGFADPEASGGRPDPEAARRYARARSALVAGEHDRAIDLFEQAREIDPGASEIALGLSDALWGAGDENRAAAVSREAIGLGDRSTRAFFRAASGAEGDEALRYALGAARAAEDSDRAGSVAAGVMLGRMLLDRGYLASGAGVLDEALGALDRGVMRDRRWRRQLVEIATRRAELRTLVGDAWLALERPDRALTHYTDARAQIERVPPTLTGRIIGAHLSAGRPALATLELVEALEKDPGIASAQTRGWCAAIGADPAAGPVLTTALESAARDGDTPGSIRSMMLGHMLAGAPDAATRGAMLGAAPAPLVRAAHCRAFIHAAGDDRARAARAAGVAEANPVLAPLLADALIRIGGDPERTIERLRGSGSAVLARAIVNELGRPELAPSNDRVLDPDTAPAARLAIEHRLASRRGDEAAAQRLADAAIDRLGSMDDAELRLLTRSLISTGRLDATRRVLALMNESPTAHRLATIARARATLGETEDRILALERAVAMDPDDATLYERLVPLLTPGAEDPDETQTRRFTELARQVNRRLPRSAAATLLRARDMAIRGMLAEAERELVALHEQYPHREIGLDLMLSVWGTLADRGDTEALGRALDWIKSRRDAAPGSVELARAHARLLVRLDREGEAETLLARLSDAIGSRAIERLHETIVRRRDASEADRLVIDRLGSRRGVEPGVERLAAAARLDRLSGVARSALLPEHPALALRSDQAREVAGALSSRLQRGRGDDERVLDLARRARAMTATGDEAWRQIEIVALAGSSRSSPHGSSGSCSTRWPRAAGTPTPATGSCGSPSRRCAAPSGATARRGSWRG